MWDSCSFLLLFFWYLLCFMSNVHFHYCTVQTKSMIHRINIKHDSLKQQLHNLCTFVTYSAVTAVCLQYPLSVVSFTLTTPHFSASATRTTSTTSRSTNCLPYLHCSFQTQHQQRPNNHRSYHDFLNLRGGARSTNSKFSIANMVSTSSATDGNTSKTTSSPPSDDPKLTALRSKMKNLGIDAFIIPSDDPHLSEYVPTAYMRRKYISGFGGSAGTAVVTHDEALLWTDSR